MVRWIANDSSLVFLSARVVNYESPLELGGAMSYSSFFLTIVWKLIFLGGENNFFGSIKFYPIEKSSVVDSLYT